MTKLAKLFTTLSTLRMKLRVWLTKANWIKLTVIVPIHRKLRPYHLFTPAVFSTKGLTWKCEHCGKLTDITSFEELKSAHYSTKCKRPSIPVILNLK